jgi:group I intron endonuclease
VINSTEISHQKKIRLKKEIEDSQSNIFYPIVNISESVIKPITFKEARPFILEYEYLGTMSTRTIQCFGLYYKNILSGAIVFSLPPSKGVQESVLGTEYKDKVCVLSRGACAYWAHPHSGSKLISFGTRWMSQYTEYKCFIAYGDPKANEIGTLYQACNWLYAGQTESKTEYYLNDKWVSGYEFRLQRKKGNLPINIQTRPSSKKHRYIFIKGKDKRETKKLKKQLKFNTFPYPKRHNIPAKTKAFNINPEDIGKGNVIYRITNTVNNKIYIGQTIQNITERYCGMDLTSSRTASSILQHAALKYGNDKFFAEVIYQSPFIDTKEILDDLNSKETYFIDFYQSNKVGYNIREGGKNHSRTEAERKRLSDSLVARKSYLRAYGDPEGNRIEVLNLSGFCKENKLDFSAMQKVSIGKKYSYKGWRKWEEGLKQYNLQESIEKNNQGSVKQYTLFKEGKQIFVRNLKQFCQDNSLNYSNMRALTQKRIKAYNGFTIKG